MLQCMAGAHAAWASPARLAGRGLRVKTFFHTNNESSSNDVPLDLTSNLEK